MNFRSSENDGCYLYAIVTDAGDRDLGPIGIGGGRVYCLGDGKVSAVVSDLDNGKIRPERRNLAAHQAVLKALMADTTPLPMAFGIIADGRGAIAEILSGNQKVFLQELRRVAGKVEMGVRVAWDVSNIFEFFVNTHTELRRVRDRYFGTNREPSQEDMIEVGRTFDRILNEDRKEHTDAILEMLSPYCHETKVNNPRDERVVANLACLVGRGDQPEFEKGLFKAAGAFDNNYSFDYNGPWAPHNFVDVDLDL
ncbi:MAG: GvpL/GvpF family gas vesicle protein [Thermodesulfobacteriota bacterium]